MRFLTIYRPDRAQGQGASPQDMADYAREQTEAGRLISQAMLDPQIMEVTFDGSSHSVGEKSDPAVGYAFIEASSRVEALVEVKRFLEVAGPGATEIRQVIG